MPSNSGAFALPQDRQKSRPGKRLYPITSSAESFLEDSRSSNTGGQFDPVDYRRLRNQGIGHAGLVEVRSPFEFAAGHIPGTVNTPMEQIESRLGDLSPGEILGQMPWNRSSHWKLSVRKPGFSPTRQ